MAIDRLSWLYLPFPARFDRAEAMSDLLPCYLSVAHEKETRLAAEPSCFGDTSLFTGRDAKERGFRDSVRLCVAHSRLRCAEFQRCAFIFDSESCAKSLRPCPDRLFSVLDDLSNSVAAHVCRYHRSIMDEWNEVVEHPLYRPPPKRPVVAEIRPTLQVVFSNNIGLTATDPV